MRLRFFSGNTKISSIGKSIWGQPYISIANENNKNEKVHYTFYFSSEGPYPEELLEAREGQDVKISGVVKKLSLERGLFGVGEYLHIVLGDPLFSH